MSILTKEVIQKILNDDWLLMDDCEGLENCTVIKELARMALAAMDGESWCLPLDYLQGHKDGLEWAAQLAEANHPETGDWLYDDPIELAKAIRKGPDMPPSQPALDTEPVAYTDERNLGYIDRGRETAYLWGKQNSESSDVALYRHAQPALVIPDEMTAEQAYEIGYYYGDPVDVFARGANWMRQHIIDSTLAAAPQSPGSEPATVPGKWIPVSERMPDDNSDVLCTAEFDGPGDWRRKVGYWHEGKWVVYGASWTPTHWMPLPAAPQELKGE